MFDEQKAEKVLKIGCGVLFVALIACFVLIVGKPFRQQVTAFSYDPEKKHCIYRGSDTLEDVDVTVEYVYYASLDDKKKWEEWTPERERFEHFEKNRVVGPPAVDRWQAHRPRSGLEHVRYKSLKTGEYAVLPLAGTDESSEFVTIKISGTATIGWFSRATLEAVLLNKE